MKVLAFHELSRRAQFQNYWINIVFWVFVIGFVIFFIAKFVVGNGVGVVGGIKSLIG